MDYQTLKKLFCDHESGHPKTHLTGYITFSTFVPGKHEIFSWKSRTYVVSSDNKAFQPDMGGYSIFGSCLDGTDRCIRMERFMAEERGGKNGWVVGDCCIVAYLLSSCSDNGISKPELYRSYEEAHEAMLRELTQVSDLDFDQLKKEYHRGELPSEEACYQVKRDAAWWSDGSTVDWKWSIHPVCIYDPLRVVIGHE